MLNSKDCLMTVCSVLVRLNSVYSSKLSPLQENMSRPAGMTYLHGWLQLAAQTCAMLRHSNMCQVGNICHQLLIPELLVSDN